VKIREIICDAAYAVVAKKISISTYFAVYEQYK